MDANILELLGAFFLGVIITIVMFWTLFLGDDDTDYDDYDEGGWPPKEKAA